MQTATIPAREHWTKTGILLEAGKTYLFSATGRWRDWCIQCGAEGYRKSHLKPFEALRRVPEANWFSLIGALDKDLSNPIDIGRIIEKEGGRYRSENDGELWCFANDIEWMYWNNREKIVLEVRQEE